MSLYEYLSIPCPVAQGADTRTTKTSSRSDTIDESDMLAVFANMTGRTTITKVDNETVDEAQMLDWLDYGS